MDKPARSKEQKSYRYLWTQSNQMTRPQSCRNTSRAPTDDSGTPKPIPAISRAPTPAFALASVPGPLKRSTNKDMQRATKLALELFVKSQEDGQFQASTAPCNHFLKACNPDFYYKSLHIECYYFCRQCEDYFDIAGAMGYNHVPFAASFLRNRINFH